MDQPKTKKKVDPYKGLKYMGYRLSQLPETYNMKDFLRYAKFQLASKTKTLLKDPIWDTYTVEELLVEFFAHMFQESSEFRVQFEQQMGDIDGSIDAFSRWADKEMAKEAKIKDKLMGEMEDNISFSPDMVIGED